MLYLLFMFLCDSNPMIVNRNVTFVSDSMTAVSWANLQNGVGSIHHLNLIYDIKEILSRHQNFEVIYNPRATNSFVDNLAKKGSSGDGNRVVWSMV
ncbi:hypothetical protein Q3G72_027830 [Acer saccharum]|nr:hypothetical protein Q3G72_027830 [Acer saccharum]